MTVSGLVASLIQLVIGVLTRMQDWLGVRLFAVPVAFLARLQAFLRVAKKSVGVPPGGHVLVVGGGVSGLTAAVQIARKGKPNVKVTILEASNRWGGNIWSRTDGLELGPRSMRSAGAHGPEALDFLLTLGLCPRPLDPRYFSRRFIFSKHGVLRLSDAKSAVQAAWKLGMLGSFLRYVLWTPFRWTRRFLLPWVRRDDSMHDFFSERFGQEAGLVLGSAITNGVFAADSKNVSARRSFPAMVDMAGSFSKTFRQQLTRRVWGLVSPPPPKAAKYSAYTFPSGMERMIDALVAELEGNASVTMHLNTPLEQLNPHSGQWAAPGLADQKADAVILCCPLPTVMKLLPETASNLSRIPLSDIVCVSCICPTRQLAEFQRGFGMLCARGSYRHSHVLGVIFESCLAQSESHPEREVLSVMMGCDRQQDRGAFRAMSDEAFSEMAKEAVWDLLQVRPSRVEETVVTRWYDCLPQYLSGNRHDRVMNTFWRQANQMERTLFGGKFFADGVGVPDCVVSGLRAAEDITVL